jgi:peroxisomal 2,4-dienoyl-CoA reductase
MPTAARSPFRPDLLAGRVALVTGGGSGICHGIARELGRHGAKLALMGRRADVLAEACKSLAADGITAVPVAGDVRDPAAAEAAVAATVAAHGRLDILVNGAAGNFLCPTDKLSPNGFKTVIDIDLNGTFHMSKAALAPLKAAGSAVILNISATLHYQGTPMQAHVMAAKAGIDALSRNLACEWGEFGIRVVTIAPGPIDDTEGMRRLAPLGAGERIAKEIPLRRLGTIADIANAAVFLVSDAAAYVTGEILVVDGGQWLARPPFIARADWERLSRS